MGLTQLRSQQPLSQYISREWIFGMPSYVLAQISKRQSGRGRLGEYPAPTHDHTIPSACTLAETQI